MNIQTSLVAEQIRLQQWADQIRDCQNRPSDMKVDVWCQEHGITKANYYYRLRRVRRPVWSFVILPHPSWNLRHRKIVYRLKYPWHRPSPRLYSIQETELQ